MSSRAKLLAELEEKSHENKEIAFNLDETQELGIVLDEGYDPYDNPGTHKVTHDPDTFSTRRRGG